jgi:hypothetical protein
MPYESNTSIVQTKQEMERERERGGGRKHLKFVILL